MPRIVVTGRATSGMDRCRRLLADKSATAARRAVDRIKGQLSLLAHHPEIGRPFDDTAELRELLIEFGSSGFVALYHYDREQDVVPVLAFRHQREAGY